MLQDASGYEGDELEQYLESWRSMIQWSQNTSALTCPAFVRIGDSSLLWEIPEDQYPSGTEMIGSVLPRLAIALSANGSLIGIAGYTVQT